MHTTDNQGYCWTCGIPMGVNDDDWLVMQAMRADEMAKEHMLTIAKAMLGKQDESRKTK